MRLLDRNFKYVPASKTDVAATWRRFGFRPTTERDRRARYEPAPPPATAECAPPKFLSQLRHIDQGTKGKLKLAIGKQ